MKISFLPVVLLAATVGLATPNLSSAAPLHIGVVNMARLLQQSPQAKAAMTLMKNKFSNRSKDLISEQGRIKGLQDKISKNGAVMSAGQLQDLQNQLDDMQRDYSRKQSDLQDDITRERNEQLGSLQRDIVEAVQTFAKSRKYNLIIGEGVFYADDTVDVTDDVLNQLQKDFKSKDATSGN